MEALRLIWDEAIPAPANTPRGTPGGAWRLVYPPVLKGSYDPVWTFTTEAPVAKDPKKPRPVHHVKAYPERTTFIRKYSRDVIKPEANIFVVTTAEGVQQRTPLEIHHDQGGSLPVISAKDKEIVTAMGINYRGADFSEYGYPKPDPTHLDFQPYGPIYSIKVDALLCSGSPGHVGMTRENVKFVCRRQMDAGGYGRIQYEFEAGLVLYFDPATEYQGKPRKLRPFDVIFIQEDRVIRPCLLTNVAATNLPEEGGDVDQTATYQAVTIPEPLSY